MAPSTPVADFVQAMEKMNVGKEASIFKVHGLTSKETETYTTNLDRVELKAWVTNFTVLMQNKHPKIRELLEMTTTQAEIAAQSDRELEWANDYLSRQIQCCLDRKASKVKAFNSRFANNAEVMQSGVRKLAHIRQMCLMLNGTEVRAAEDSYTAKKFFRDKMSREEVVAAAWMLQNEFMLLKFYSGDLSVMYEILRKLPENMSFVYNQLWNEISHDEMCGHLRYTLDQFIDIIGIHMSGQGGLKNSQPRSPRSGRGRGHPRANSAESEPNDVTHVSGLKCVACGQSGHGVKECTKACPKCKSKPCPGTSGRDCVVNTNTDVPKEVLNALGKPIPPFLRDQLVQKNKAYREGLNAGRGGGRVYNAGRGGKGRGKGFTRSANVAESGLFEDGRSHNRPEHECE